MDRRRELRQLILAGGQTDRVDAEEPAGGVRARARDACLRQGVTAFAMERVTVAERATLSAAMSVLWQAGWVIGGIWYALLQARLGFEAGYTVNFVTIITLYSIATALYWIWFRRVDQRVLAARLAA